MTARNTASPMVSVGNRIWKLSVKANCSLDSSTASMSRLPHSAATAVIRDHLGHAGGELLARGHVQELVGAVGVGMGAEQAGHQELGLGELLAQHAHERDAAAG